ncbi:MAG: PrsW family glutamic-type intramembrane protease [Candidatus Paceibacterota bacterium]
MNFLRELSSDIGIFFSNIEPSTETIIFAFLGGLLPALLWLWFWLKEDALHPEPRRYITLTFIAGILTVPLVLPFQIAVYNNFTDPTLMIILWAGIEEVMKFVIAYIVALNQRFVDEPIDMVIYMITVALGFAAAENALFIFHPLTDGNTLVSIITGNLRFIGSTLLHVFASATIGVMLGFAFYKGTLKRFYATMIGIILATALHTLFNFFIIEDNGKYTFLVFATVWAAIIMLILMFERIKRIYK